VRILMSTIRNIADVSQSRCASWPERRNISQFSPAAKLFFNCLNGDMSEQKLDSVRVRCPWVAEGYQETAHSQGISVRAGKGFDFGWMCVSGGSPRRSGPVYKFDFDGLLSLSVLEVRGPLQDGKQFPLKHRTPACRFVVG
jgi:hypothetical protein